MFGNVDPAVESFSTFSAMTALFDNYSPSPSDVEDHTEQEHQEELEFLTQVSSTPVMQTALQYLQDRGETVYMYFSVCLITVCQPYVTLCLPNIR